MLQKNINITEHYVVFISFYIPLYYYDDIYVYYYHTFIYTYKYLYFFLIFVTQNFFDRLYISNILIIQALNKWKFLKDPSIRIIKFSQNY